MRSFLLFAVALWSATLAFGTEYNKQTAQDSYGHTYTYYTNDPVGLRVYSFENGLKLFVSVNKDEPQVKSFIAVKAGSTYDPKETTGLAHYLEHMMFKGTSKIGSLDWNKEQPLLDTISKLYELHKTAQTDEEKTAIYAKIDSVSQLASTYAISNEYDYMCRSIGATGTNAYTWLEETVYLNRVPSSSLKKLLILERERFGELTLRLFHTELEAVYEEFNMSQDNDSRKAHYAFFENLFPTHPYGTQTTIGKAEHLKNPSMVNIHNYWDTYYVPNNIAICLTGDLDPATTAHWVDSLWGNLAAKPVPPLNLPKEKPILGPIEESVYGPNPESVMIGFRTGGIGSDDELYVSLIDYLLCAQGKAGLIDLDLVKAQKILFGFSNPYFMRDYGIHMLAGGPRQGQTLEEVKDLLLKEIDKVKKGEFEEWMLDAIVNDIRLHRIRKQESQDIASEFVNTFTSGSDWDDYLSFPDKLAKITKEDIVTFANKFYTDSNYVVVYKRIGTDSTIVKVDKPKITPIEINRKDQSAFLQNFTSIPQETIHPMFINYDSLLTRGKLQDGITYSYIKNDENELFSLFYIIERGKLHDKTFPLAISYLEYLGTDKYSSEELAKELFKYGLEFGVNTGDDRSYVYISGLNKSFEKGLELIEHILHNAKPNKEAYQNLVSDILKSREDAKIDKNAIQGMLLNYGKYGKRSPLHNILSQEELEKMDPSDLTKMIHNMCNYQHDVFYYGQLGSEEAKKIIAKHHTIKKIQPVPMAEEYIPLETKEPRVYFVDYDMVQANIYFIARGKKFDKNQIPIAKMYNEYFGSGLSSIIFQDIRESKALAYRAFSHYSLPKRADDYAFLYSFVGTNADKLGDAVSAMQKSLSQMTKNDVQIEASKQAILDGIATDRIIKSGIYFSYMANKDRGIDFDIRKEVYEKTKSLTIEELDNFFNENVANRPFTYLVMGNKKDIDMSVLEKLGPVQELSLEDLFGY